MSLTLVSIYINVIFVLSFEPDVRCTFPVLSVDHKFGVIGKYFNFDVSLVDAVLGRTDWNNEIFATYNDRTEQIHQVIIWNYSNGGSIGDGHGRKHPMESAYAGDYGVGDNISFMDITCHLPTPSPTKSPTLNTIPPSTYPTRLSMYTSIELTIISQIHRATNN